jgi:predicted transcriptional regulator
LKNIKKQFWFDPETDRLLREYSKRTGINQSNIVRMLIRGYQPREKPDERFYNCMRQLYGISNNLNQIAVIANKTGKYDSIWLIDEITKINKLTVDLEQHFLRPVYEPLIRKGSDNLYGTNQQRL